ncbi:YwhD family protein [Salinicoccus jeotgali]|uniref:YwhD family protein n=1 Tax=Salinicoccus jeotgali TaxID=381634 RepID=A0ABP7FCL0_9STAP
MANESNGKKKGFQFNIIKNDPLDGHKGQNIGSISLENVAPVYVNADTGETYIDMGGLHGRAEVERRVKWVTDKSEVEGEDAKNLWLVWVAVERKENGPQYSGIGACFEMINRTKRRAYKLMPEHVNMLDRAVKGKIDLGEMDGFSRTALKKFLISYNEEMWNNATDLQEEMKND